MDMGQYSLPRRLLPVLVTAGFAIVLILVLSRLWVDSRDTESSTSKALAEAAKTADLAQFCAACHTYPPPEIYPRHMWRELVTEAYHFYDAAEPAFKQKYSPPQLEDVVRYYEERAPTRLPRAGLSAHADSSKTPNLILRPAGVPGPTALELPAISHVDLVHLSDARHLDLLACDMRAGEVLVLKPYETPASWKTVGRVPHPAHAAAADVNGDGIKDILVANLGNFMPTDEKKGSVVWLKGAADGSYASLTLLGAVGRVADVEAADFDGDGDVDLVAAVFGWRQTGEILWLENRTTDWTHPEFVPHVLDRRHGTIHVPVADLNGDGRPDFVALISQEHETVEAFLNEGTGAFRKETIYTAPHPAYGSTGIQLVDLDSDGDLDVLYTNGDALDHLMLKPYHGVQWLENRGSFPYLHHQLASMYGAHRAVAADLRGCGRLDIIAVGLLPRHLISLRVDQDLDSVILLEQEVPGRFVRHSLETYTCDHVACATGDIDGNGKPDVVVGMFQPFGSPSTTPRLSSPVTAITIWKNLGSHKGNAGIPRNP